MKSGKRVSRSKNPYYEFQISAPLKKNIKNRLNQIELNKEEIKAEIKEVVVVEKKYSTEIILQVYNSTLTMLGSSGSNNLTSTTSNKSNDFDQTNQKSSDDLDDEIPF